MSAELAVQKALRARLVNTGSVTALVSAANILDRNSRPAPDPSIIIGEDQVIDAERIARDVQRIVCTLHIWKKEPSLVGVKAIGGAVRTAINSAKLVLDAPFQCADAYVSGVRYLRDPDGETSHGVVTVETLVKG